MSTLPTNPSPSFVKRNLHLYPSAAAIAAGHAKTDFIAACKNEKSKRVRQSAKPLMNKLETEFYSQLRNDYHFSTTEIVSQEIRFRLGNGIWYKPDFVVIQFDRRPIAFEVKGPHAFRGGFENLKVAASKHQCVEWRLVWKENGRWKEQIILP